MFLVRAFHPLVSRTSAGDGCVFFLSHEPPTQITTKSTFWRHLMTRETGAGPETERTQDQHFTTLPKMMRMSKRLEDRITWSHGTLEELSGRGGRSPLYLTWERQRMSCRGACFPRCPLKKRRGPRMEEGFKGPGGEHIENYGQQVMSVRTLEEFVRKSTWQVADVRRPLVSASHIIHARNDLFIGKDEAYHSGENEYQQNLLLFSN